MRRKSSGNAKTRRYKKDAIRILRQGERINADARLSGLAGISGFIRELLHDAATRISTAVSSINRKMKVATN